MTYILKYCLQFKKGRKMFIIHKTPETTERYSRLLGNTLANISFISFENKAFFHNFKENGSNYNYQYIADFEFIDYIAALTHCAYPHQKYVIICIDNLPDEVKGLLLMNPDVVNAFKSTFEDLQLDHLAKEI